ncbi:uromodulin-like [Pseudophryne corroboree]|uniref:uromodulin-like n=1 Tax=Pseudophryne corroboree TaxID=495146 RepID=UPI003081CB7E
MNFISTDAQSCSYCNSTVSASCNQQSNYVICSCNADYVGNGFSCTKRVFCDNYPCCPQGYSWNTAQKACVDINECSSSSTNVCLTGCTNTPGSYRCTADPANPPCPTSACPTGNDCIKDQSNTEQCIDPCSNYQELDGSNQLYTMNSSGRFSTDRYYFGWYRYKNGLRPRQGCVAALKCGCLQLYSIINHPSIYNGVKSVAVLYNTLSGCYTGQNISVKACPGGYYVYKFAGLLLAEDYCTGELNIFI